MDDLRANLIMLSFCFNEKLRHRSVSQFFRQGKSGCSIGEISKLYVLERTFGRVPSSEQYSSTCDQSLWGVVEIVGSGVTAMRSRREGKRGLYQPLGMQWKANCHPTESEMLGEKIAWIETLARKVASMYVIGGSYQGVSFYRTWQVATAPRGSPQ